MTLVLVSLLTPQHPTEVSGRRGSRVSVLDGQSRGVIHVEKEVISCIRAEYVFESICNENNNPGQYMVGHLLEFGN